MWGVFLSKKSSFIKAGKFVSAGTGLVSALLPSITAKANPFIFSKDADINLKFNESWLSYIYYLLRFDFLKNYILNKVTKESVEESVETIKGLLEKKRVFDFAFGKDKIKYIFNFCKTLTGNPGMEQNYQWMNEVEVFSNFKERERTTRKAKDIVFGCDEYEQSKGAIKFIKKTILYCDFFNFLINKVKKPSLVQHINGVEGLYFEFASPIDLGDKGQCVSLSFNFYENEPSFVITCSKGSKLEDKNTKFQGKTGVVFYSCETKDSVSLEEMEDMLKTVKNEIQNGHVKLKEYEKDNPKETISLLNGEVSNE